MLNIIHCSSRETQIDTTIKYHFTPARNKKKKKKENITSVGKAVEKLELDTAGGNIKWGSH